MGSALVCGWLKNGLNNISILTPETPPKNIIDKCQAWFTSPEDISQDFDVIVLAVKPQILENVCESLTSIVKEKTLILSVAAGKSLPVLAKYFTKTVPIVRIMPNLPASIGVGVSVCISNVQCHKKHTEIVETLISSVGQVEWITDEHLMDAVTAVSGSGPAYLFHLLESMTKAGIECGLPKELSKKLARQTIIGSAQILDAHDELTATQLRESVTSKGGTTEAALNVLMKDNVFSTLVEEAVKSAKKRSEKL